MQTVGAMSGKGERGVANRNRSAYHSTKARKAGKGSKTKPGGGSECAVSHAAMPEEKRSKKGYEPPKTAKKKGADQEEGAS